MYRVTLKKRRKSSYKSVATLRNNIHLKLL
jgi:hypothetical protein